MDKTTQIANRYGLNTRIYNFADYVKYLKKEVTEKPSPLMIIDFAKLSEINLEGDSVWATGGQTGGNIVAFNNPLAGSFKLSTQIITLNILQLLAGKNIKDTTEEIVFENTADGTISPYYVIESETIFQDKNGAKYSQDLTFHKAKAKRALNIQYDGSADPVSIDIEFELAQDDDGKILTIKNALKDESTTTE